MLFKAQQVVITYDDFLKFLLEHWIQLLKSWMQGIVQLHLSCHFVSNSQIAVADHCLSHVVLHFPRCFVTDPGVNTSTAREDPQQIGKVKVLSQYLSDNDHCNLEVGEAPLAYVCPFAAGSNIVVVVHIDIEDHLFVGGNEGFFVTSIVSVGWDVVYSTDVDFVWYSVHQCFFEVFSCLEA